MANDTEEARVLKIFKTYTYSVYYNSAYRFPVQRKGEEWEAFDVRKGEARTLDGKLARNICLLIESKED